MNICKHMLYWHVNHSIHGHVSKLECAIVIRSKWSLSLIRLEYVAFLESLNRIIVVRDLQLGTP